MYHQVLHVRDDISTCECRASYEDPSGELATKHDEGCTNKASRHIRFTSVFDGNNKEGKKDGLHAYLNNNSLNFRTGPSKYCTSSQVKSGARPKNPKEKRVQMISKQAKIGTATAGSMVPSP
jgi:hypothetical protein